MAALLSEQARFNPEPHICLSGPRFERLAKGARQKYLSCPLTVAGYQLGDAHLRQRLMAMALESLFCALRRRAANPLKLGLLSACSSSASPSVLGSHVEVARARLSPCQV